jgi:Flp pilus assembly protein TadD
MLPQTEMLTIKNAVPKKFLLLPLLALLVPGCTPPGPRALLAGKKLLERGRYSEAIAELKTATSLLSTNAQAWNYLGLSYHCAGQATNAAQAYQKALALDHDLVDVHYNLGCLWLEQNRLDLAKPELTTYTAFRRNSLEGWLKLAAAQLRSVRPGPAPARALDLATAEKSYDEARRLSPRNSEALNGLGLIELERNRPREAAQCFAHAVKQEPRYAPALLNLAIVSQAYLNDRPAALQNYREYLALTVHPANEAAVQAAASELEQELNPAPRKPPTVASAAPAAVVANAPKPAVHAASPARPEPATDVVNAAPTPPPVEPKIEVAKLSPEPAVKPAPESPSSPQPAHPVTQPNAPSISQKTATETPKTAKPGFFSRINPLHVLHRDSKANSQLTEASAGSGAAVNAAETSAPKRAGGTSADSSAPLIPGGRRYHYRAPAKPVAGDEDAAQREFAQGFQAQQAGHLPEAIQSYRRATQLDPADFDAYYNLGLAATSAGNIQQALAAYEHALAIRPESPDARYNFGLVLKKANYLPDAINEFNRLLSTYPKEPRAHLALGNIYAQVLHQPAKAREHYLKVLENDPHNFQAAAIREWMMANPP